MEVKLSREDVLKIAKLAKLELNEEEIKKYQKDLSQILSYVQQLDDINTDNLNPTLEVTGLSNIYREDKFLDYGYKEEDLLNNVPETEDGYIKVKRIIE